MSPPSTVYRDAWISAPHSIDASIVLSTGNVVKIKSPQNERFWVVLLHPLEDDTWIGTVDNHLLLPHSYTYGDRVAFSRNDIWDYKDQTAQDAQRERLIPMLQTMMEAFLVENGRLPSIAEMDQLLSRVEVENE